MNYFHGDEVVLIFATNIEFEQRENIFFFNYSVPKLVTTLNFNLLERLLGFVFVPVSTDRKNEATEEKESKQKKKIIQYRDAEM